VDTLRHSAVMGWDVCVMVFLLNSWDQDKREKRVGGGGRKPRSGSIPAPLKTFHVDFHHPLEHLSRFGIFGKSNVL
jgi:1,6-anhydro-N-acetylmuramate kinase